jgi:hypothetical protein
MRPAIHPNDTLLSLPFGILVPRDDLLRCGIGFLPDSHTADVGEIVGGQRVALPLRHGDGSRNPTLRSQPACGAQREALILAKLRAGTAPCLILVDTYRPVSGQIDLRQGHLARDRNRHDQNRNAQSGFHQFGGQPRWMNTNHVFLADGSQVPHRLAHSEYEID